MDKIHLIMPMGGAGSRFFKNGFVMPKPLIEIQKEPFPPSVTKVNSAHLFFTVSSISSSFSKILSSVQ